MSEAKQDEIAQSHQVDIEEKHLDEVEVVPVSPEDDRRVKRKIDRVVMSLAAACYFMQYMDKRGLSFAAIFGMQKDLGLVGQDYSWAVSMFSFGTLTMMFMAIKIMHWVNIRVYVGTTILIWGCIMMAQAAPQNATGLLIARYFLGVAEGSAYPAFIILISIWYRKNEHAGRFAALYGADIVAQGFGGLMLFGYSSINGAIAGWRIAMICAGCMTLIVGGFFAWLMPSSIQTAWFLTQEEKDIAVARVAQEHASAEENKWDWDQFWEAIKDPKLYICFLWCFIIVAATVLNFGTLILNGLGFLPPCAMQCVILISAILASKYFPNSRWGVQVGFALIPLLGAILLQTLPYDRKWSLTGALWLSTCNHPLIVMNLAIISSNIKGHTRKSIFSSAYYMGYATGNIVGPQMYLSTESPLYRTAMRSICGLYAGYIVLSMLFAFLCWRENKRRDKLAVEGVEEAVARPATDFSNLSDRKDLSFRYIL